MNILWCVRWSFRVKSPQKINKIKKHEVPNLYHSLHRIRFYLEFCLKFRQHGNVSIIKMWSFLKCRSGRKFLGAGPMFSKMKTNFKKSVGYGKYSSLSKINRQWRKWRTRAKSLELKLSCGNDHVVKNSIVTLTFDLMTPK